MSSLPAAVAMPHSLRYAPPHPPLSGTRNAPTSFAFLTIRDRLPVILTKIVDRLSRLAHGANDDAARVKAIQGVIQRLGLLRYELQTNKQLTPLTCGWERSSENTNHMKSSEINRLHVDSWNDLLTYLAANGNGQVGGEGQRVPVTWFSAPWLFAECYMYRRVWECFHDVDCTVEPSPASLWSGELLWSFDQKRESFLAAVPVCGAALNTLPSC
jgi:hypothetical protein